MKKIIALILIFAFAISLYACGEVPAMTTNGGENLEKPPATTTNGNHNPTEPTPSQTEPKETGPTQPVLCSHEYVSGACKYCGALKPSTFLTYALNEDGKSYCMTGMDGQKYEPFTAVIADTYNGLPVTAIGDGAFYDRWSDVYLETVIIPDSVISIGASAFAGCEYLTKVTIGAGLKEIGSNAFGTTAYYRSDDCPVSEVHITNLAGWYDIDFKSDDSNPLHSGGNLYVNGELVTELNVPEGITAIGDYAFYGSNIASVTIPDSVTSIGESAFSKCRALASVTIPNSVNSIGAGAFDDCDNLNCKRYDTAYYLGNSENPYLYLVKASVTDISGCNIHKNTKIIGNAFSGCTMLTSITIPEGAISIGAEAFYECWRLISITIPKSVISIGDSAFRNCGGLTNVFIPEGVACIGNCAFAECRNLTTVSIPASVTSIGHSAFRDPGGYYGVKAGIYYQFGSVVQD